MTEKKKTKAGNLGRWPNKTCKICGKNNIYPEKDRSGRFSYRKKLICFKCLEKEQEKYAKPNP